MGAVLNESMNSGCAVIASDAIGSVPFLIKNGVNGIIYKDGNQKDLSQVLMELLDNPEKRKKQSRSLSDNDRNVEWGNCSRAFC